VKTVVDQRFREEARRFQLAFTCEACAYFAPESQRCSNGYPNHAHRARPLNSQQELEFCKEFELA
jgi:hypothetical protein